MSLTFNVEPSHRNKVHKGDRIRIVWGGVERVVEVLDVQEPDDDQPIGPVTLTVAEARQ